MTLSVNERQISTGIPNVRYETLVVSPSLQLSRTSSALRLLPPVMPRKPQIKPAPQHNDRQHIERRPEDLERHPAEIAEMQRLLALAEDARNL